MTSARLTRALVALGLSLAARQPAQAASPLLRHTSTGDATRIVINLPDGDISYRSERLSNPDRIFFDLRDVVPGAAVRVPQTIPVNDRRVRQIRVALTQRSVVRVVLDLESPVDFTAKRDDDQLIIELRPSAPAAITRTSPPAESTIQEPLSHGARPFTPPPAVLAPVPRASVTVMPLPPKANAETVVSTTPPVSSPLPVQRTPAAPPPPAPTPLAVTARPVPATVPLGSSVAKRAAERATVATTNGRTSTPLAARQNREGERSLTRVLGLKLRRVVLDPGHGGHDLGSTGPTGLQEKELVLDVAQRLATLLERRLGSEVVFTRRDDTFIPLEERTLIANDRQADLFLSIHANSSPVSTATGVETYYLNVHGSRDSLEVAARENAGAALGIHDLREVVQKIALTEKLDESREFAHCLQAALQSHHNKLNGQARDRGVKRAPFVVLIGAAMPSVLAEVGFLSNPRDEKLMKKPDYRQKLAEALYRGVYQYASSLSRFEMAQRDE